jgi:hypothetical protein
MRNDIVTDTSCTCKYLPDLAKPTLARVIVPWDAITSCLIGRLEKADPGCTKEPRRLHFQCDEAGLVIEMERL